MAETSRGQFTIMLGRSGPVVKRAGPPADVGFSESMPAIGTKRSVRDRLGSTVDNSLSHGSQLNSKRQRGVSNISSLSSNGVKDLCIGKDDLRYKLMQKNVLTRAHIDDERKFVDLREKLCRTERPQTYTLDTRPPMPEPNGAGILGKFPPTRSAENLPQMVSVRNSYPGWTLDQLRRKSPDGIQGSSRVISGQKNVGDVLKMPSYDDVRSLAHMNKGIDLAWPMGAEPLMLKSTLPGGSVKFASPLLAQTPPSGGIAQKSSYTAGQQTTIDSLLDSLGLGKYAVLFKAEEVDMTALKQMGENDLKELGIPMGPRKKILLALLPRSKRQPS